MAIQLVNNLPLDIRKESYDKSKPDFKSQEAEILKIIEESTEPLTAWEIYSKTNYLITSVRRALSNMIKNNIIVVAGKKWHEPTQRNVTSYKSQFKLFP